MRHTMLMLAAVTACLSACNDKPGDRPGDKTGEIAATDAMGRQAVKDEVDKVQLKPGQWEGRFTVQAIDMPGAPAGVQDQMKSMMSKTAHRYCITPEQAAKPSGDMFAAQDNKDCTYDGFDASGGKVQGQLSCKSQGGTMNATLSGSYAPEHYGMDMDMKMAGGPNGTTMAITARSEGQWIGPECASDT